MIELGELERRHEDFAQRRARIVVVSLEGRDEAQRTQNDFPHLVVLADQDRTLSEAVDAIHPDSRPGGGDASAPTTFLIDSGGTVRWLYRPPRAISRLSPDELLAAVDRHLTSE